jgi:hypothetical protein
MKRLLYLAISLALAARCAAQGVPGMAEVAIIDRDNGTALSTHYYHGEYWVAGRPGARYAIEIHNRAGERLLAVTSVDGVNVLSGATAGWDQGGYVFDAGDRYQISGWRKSDTEVAAFTFTDLPNSYAARTGRPANVGVIGVAIFRERRPLPVEQAPTIGQLSGAADAARQSTLARSAPSAPSAGLSEAQPRAKLGTGHGGREYSYSVQTEFVRLQPQPNQVIRIHYDSLDNLLAMGVIPRPRVTPPGADPFPNTPNPQYVPDPPG